MFNDLSSPLALLRSRRSARPRDLVEPGPDAGQLRDILSLAMRVPDHGKLGPWRFVVMEGDARDRAGEAIAGVIAADEGVDEVRLAAARNHFKRASAVVMVVSTAAPHPKIPEWEQQLSSGAVCFAMLVSAHALGYAASWLTEWYAYDRQVLDALGLKPNERIAGFVHIGRPEKPADDRPRPPLNEIVTRYGS